ncbi:MAG: hypothetical protein EOM26_03095 [Alphaproteobacteria bacterium]|nr:hypothetical protein [Alphaproteobacteria bacterium]
MNREVFSAINAVKTAPFDALCREMSDDTRTLLRNGNIVPVTFNGGPPVGLAVKYLPGVLLAGGFTRLESVNIELFKDNFPTWCVREQDRNHACAVTVNESPHKGFVYMTKGAVRDRWEEFQVMLPAKIVHELGEALDIPVWPWVELEAKGCSSIKASGAYTLPYILLDEARDKENLTRELELYGKPVRLMFRDGKGMTPLATLLAPEKLDDLRAWAMGTDVQEIPAGDLTHTSHRHFGIPDDKICLMRNAQKRSEPPQAVLMSLNPPSLVASFIEAKSRYAPMRSSEYEGRYFVEMSAGAGGFAQKLLMAMLQASQSDGGSLFRIRPRYGHLQTREIAAFPVDDGQLDLLSRTPAAPESLRLRTAFQDTLHRALHTAYSRLLDGQSVVIVGEKPGRPFFVLAEGNGIGGALRAKELAAHRTPS